MSGVWLSRIWALGAADAGMVSLTTVDCSASGWDPAGCGGCPGAVGIAGAFRPGFLAAGGSVASFSLRRRSTGASTVEDADRTNSPMSFNIVRTVLLSTPSSFASS
jgi:hypothetical protein